MQLKELANKIGIPGKYPEAMEAYFHNLTQGQACDLQALEALQETYGLFGNYYGQVYSAGQAINQDPLRSLWVQTAGAYIADATVEQTYQVPAPEMNGKAENDFLALFVLMTQMPKTVAEYICRGFSEAELRQLFSAFAFEIGKVEQQTGYAGINQGYYNWLAVFAKAKIFLANGFWFELGQFPISAMWLKNTQTGEIMPVVLRGPFTADGKYRIGSAGFENCTDVLEITFEETEEAYIGHRVCDCVVSHEKEAFLKSQWQCIGKPYDICLSLHIPEGADISSENFSQAVALAREIAQKRYPEIKSNVVYCSSWLLDPQLCQLLGEHTRLAAFGKCFCRFPQKNDGKSAFGFVFPKAEENYENLPENTSLQRKMKRHYMEGKFIYFTAGIYNG